MYDINKNKFKHFDMELLTVDYFEEKTDHFIVTIGILYKNNAGVFIVDTNRFTSEDFSKANSSKERDHTIFAMLYPHIENNIKTWCEFVKHAYLEKQKN